MDCDASLAGRHGNTYVCVPCARARRSVYSRERSRRVRRDPELGPAALAYARDWKRRKRASRVYVPVLAKCGGLLCPNTFEVNRIGRPRQFCRDCAASYDGYKSPAKYDALLEKRKERRRAA